MTQDPTPTREREAVLKVDGLRIVLDPSGVDIDDEVSLVIHRGEVLGLVGESASGKTTVGTNLIADGLGRALIGIERDTGVG